MPEAAARLHAIVARLYQLSPDEFEHVLSTFPLIAKQDRDAAMREFMKKFLDAFAQWVERNIAR